MDKGLFTKLIRGGHLVRSWTLAGNGLPVYWTQMSMLFRSTWRIQADSAQAKAHIRACIWIYETFTVQQVENVHFAVITDADVGILDFNPAIFHRTMRIGNDQFPLQKAIRLFSFGVPKIVPMFLNIFRRACPAHGDNMVFCGDYKDALYLVADASTVPEYWIEQEHAGEKYASDRTSTWCYERCLSDHNKVSTSDLFNPPPWPYGGH